MPAQDIVHQAIVAGGTRLQLSAFISITGAVNAPFLVVTALDRDEYAAGETGATGSFSQGSAQIPLVAGTGNERAAGIVYQWIGGQYTNALYGALANLIYVTAPSAAEVTNISWFTTPSASLAAQYAMNPIGLLQKDPAGYAGSVTIVTGNAVVAQAATPDGIAARAAQFVGQACNDDGCWNLAATIAAERGAGLPLSATALGLPGRPNGAWVVVYNGPAHASLAWKSMVTAGDVIVFGTPGGGGHIATCVAGSGPSALLIDNITYVNAQGQISNPAHDGSPADVLIAAPHPAVQEWAGVQANSVVIYALDTPVITAVSPGPVLADNAVLNLAWLASIADLAGKPVTQVQVYDTATDSTLLLNGVAITASSQAAPISAAGLSALSVLAGAHAGSDAVTVRAFNGIYWGDWATITVGIGSPAAAGGLQVDAPAFAGFAPIHAVHDAILFAPAHL
jgi:hypothetical protein